MNFQHLILSAQVLPIETATTYVHQISTCFRWFLWMKIIKMNIQFFLLCPLVRPFAYFISDCATRTCMRFGSLDYFPLPFLHVLYMRLVSLICTCMIYVHNLKGLIKYGAFLYSLQASLSSVNLKLALYIQPSTLYNKSQHLKLSKSQTGSEVTV
jgi:hypothetical protein